MARHGVTYQDIASAANVILGQGKNVTIENIRAHLGTGSIGTINKYLRQWKEAQNSKIASKENLPENLIALVKGLWEGILTESSQRFESVEASYQQEILELKAELEKYKQNNQRWQKLFNQWQQEKAVFANEKLTLDQALAFSYKENQSLQSKHEGLLQQFHEKQERVEELHRLHQQTQKNLEHYREATREQRLLDQQQFEKEKQQLLYETKELKEQLVIQKAHYSEIYQQHQLLNQSYVELKNQHQLMASSVEALKDELEGLKKNYIEIQQASKHYQDQLKENKIQLENKLAEFISLQSDNKMLIQQTADTKQALRDLRDQHNLLANKNWELAQEKAQLEGQLKQMQASIIA